MNRSLRINGIALLVSALLVGCGGHTTSTIAAQDEALAALKSLRTSGVLSEEEYQAKLATLQGPGSTGLGDGGSVGEIPGTPDATRALGFPDNGAAGLSTSGSEFAGAPPARRAGNANTYSPAAQNTPRAVHNRVATRTDSQPDARTVQNPLATQTESQPDARASASQNVSAHVNPLRSFLSQARAAKDTVARSAHDLALRIRDGASHANSSAGQQALTNQGAQGLQSAGQEFSGGDPNSNPGDAANRASGNPPQH
jgi:hypothetical protein